MNEILTKQAIKEIIFARIYPREWRRMIAERIWQECILKMTGGK